MSILKKQVVSEKAMLLWLGYTFVCSIVTILLAAVAVYFLYGCWPVTRYGPTSNTCLANIQPQYLVLSPVILGVLAGTVLTWRATRNT